MKTKKRTLQLVFFIFIMLFSTKLQLTEGKIYTDPEGDVMLIEDGVYQEHTTLRNDMDIISFEITPTAVYLTLKDDVYTKDYRRYSIEIYWNDIVEDRGFNFYKNQTKCLYDFGDAYSQSIAYNSEGDQIARSTHHTATVTANRIYWPISTDMFYLTIINPVTVFVVTIYSETFGMPTPLGNGQEFYDYYPDDSQTFYILPVESGFPLIFPLIGFSIIFFIVIRFRKRT
ncbi:MAG: hypothetical protein ACTSYF_02240 [Promethearchaeota archaeon]